MGKHNNNNKNNSASRNTEQPYDLELKVLIDKCNVCHSNLNVDEHGKLCGHHSECNLLTHFVTFFCILRMLPQILIDQV